MDKLKIAITHGDLNGIGYNCILTTFETADMLELCTPIIYGSPKAATYYGKYLNSPVEFSIIQNAAEAHKSKLNLLVAIDEEIKLSPGNPNRESARAGLFALNRALDDYKENAYHALVTMPTGQELMHDLDSTYTNEIEYIAHHIGKKEEAIQTQPSPLYVTDRMRVALLSQANSLNGIITDVTKENIIAKVELVQQTLRCDFRISNPRIAVLAVNSKIDAIENEVIAPTIKELSEKGIACFGPYLADKYFGEYQFDHFDATLAIYYNQAIPQMAMADKSVKVLTMGLPLVHCTCVDNKFVNLNELIYLATDVCRNRKAYDEAHTNPLPKLYHEHKEGEEHRPPRFTPLDFLTQ